MISRTEATSFAGIWAGAILAKVALLLTSQRALDGDEAILGLMALHIKEGLSHPLFFYGQSYDAGSGVLAHAAALAFQIGGVSAISMKVTALFVWLAMAVLASDIIRRWLGWRAAALAGALILWSPSSVEWGLKARGGYMLAIMFTLAMIGFAIEENRNYWRAGAIGAFGAAAIWAQPSVLPAVVVIGAWVVIEFFLERQVARSAMVVVAAAVLSVVPVVAMRTSSDSWHAPVGATAHRDIGLLFGSLVPHVFTPEIDSLFPASPSWVTAVGYLWFAAVAVACSMAIVTLMRADIPDRLRRPTAMLVAATCAAPLAIFMVDAEYARPRHLLMFYPLACLTIAAVFEMWRERTRQRWPRLFIAALLLSGLAVHLASMGPASIHGAGEQEVRVPAFVVDNMLADLNRHNVECVFSESPMLQWNLMFSSTEQIAARWTTAQDRWQPYVERVNTAFAAGKRCAVLLRNVPYHESIAQLQGHFGEKSEQLTVFTDNYALLYDPPRKFIIDHFQRASGWN